MPSKNLPDEFIDYFRDDYSLVIILYLLEKYDAQGNYILFSSLLKSNYCQIPSIKTGYLSSMDDCKSPEETIFTHVQNMSEELNFFSIPLYTLTAFYGVEKAFFQKILADIKENIIDESEAADYVSRRADEFFELKKLRDKKFAKSSLKKIKELKPNSLINFKLSENDRKTFIPLLDGIAEHVVVHLQFNEPKVAELKSKLQQYLQGFSKDDHINEYGLYRGLDHHFTKQLENLFTYIATLTKIDDVIHVPLATLQNNDFEIIKLLAYLQLNKKITVLSWKDKDFLRVKFLFQPMSIDGLYKPAMKEAMKNEPKNDVPPHYNVATHVLFFKEKSMEFMGKPNQKMLLEVLFSNPYKKWTYKDIEYAYDPTLGVEFEPDADFWRKHYNAATDINTAIAIETGVKEFLQKDTKTIQINQYYVQ